MIASLALQMILAPCYRRDSNRTRLKNPGRASGAPRANATTATWPCSLEPSTTSLRKGARISVSIRASPTHHPCPEPWSNRTPDDLRSAGTWPPWPHRDQSPARAFLSHTDNRRESLRLRASFRTRVPENHSLPESLIVELIGSASATELPNEITDLFRSTSP